MIRKSARILIVTLMHSVLYVNNCPAQETETIFDRKVNITEGLQEVPMVPRWERELGIKGNHVLAGDVNLWTEEVGEGRPLVLICGGPGTSHHYFHPHFLGAAEYCRVIYYDLRGVGMSDYAPGDGYSVEQAAHDLEELRRALDIDSWVVLGLSFGAAIAEYYAIEYPQRVQGLVLVGAFTPTTKDLGIGSRQRDYQSPEEIDRIGRIYSIAGERTAPAHSDDISPELQAKMVYNGFLNGDWKRRHMHKISNLELARYARYEWVHDKNYYMTMLRDGLNLDFTNHFQDCPIPMLIFEGKWDLAYGENKHNVMQEIFPKANLIYLENSGHLPFEDEPNVFFDHLQNFIDNMQPIDQQQLKEWQNNITNLPKRKG